MSFDSGIRNVKCIQNVKSRVAGERAIPEVLENKIFSTEKAFRGFHKIPIVVLERCNILPFLNNNRITFKQEIDSEANGFGHINLHLQKLALQCSVVLKREDLENLKRDTCKKDSGDATSKSNAVSNGIKTVYKTAMKQDNRYGIISKGDKDNTRPHKRLCGKYYSSNYTLTRHKATQHGVLVNKGLQCYDCEETFVWPSLLKNHKCIRMNIPEMPFEDARPEIMFENMGRPCVLNREDYGMDFDIPAPIVELTEYDQLIETEPAQQMSNLNNFTCVMPLPNANYKLVVQEVPIEF